jgi:type I restriction enzyme S subunit
MSRLEKYTTYKDSGVEWLGEIPEGWETLSNKNIFKIKQKLVGKKSSEYDLLSLTLKGIIKRDMENPQGKFPAEFNTYQEVKQGDFVFCLFDVEETPRTVGLSQFDGMITGAYTVMTTKGIDKDYLYYFYLNLDSSKRFKPLYRGLRNTIPKDSFFSFKTFIPPKEEQTKIASFLDEKTAQIDKAISQKEKLIELLKERRQITINEAVTKGLDKDVEFKDSGVEWIGEIPKHWEISKVKNIFKLIIEPAPKANDEELLSIYTDIGVRPRKDLAEKGNKASTTDGYWRVKKGDFIVNKLLAWMGAIGLSEYEGVTSPAYDILRAKKDIVGIYYHELFRLKVFSQEMKKYSRGIMDMRLRLYFDKFGDILIPYPSHNEQLKIVKYIDNQNEKINKAIELQQNYIAKLKEYKTSLIDSVVTGKLRVCDE